MSSLDSLVREIGPSPRPGRDRGDSAPGGASEDHSRKGLQAAVGTGGASGVSGGSGTECFIDAVKCIPNPGILFHSRSDSSPRRPPCGGSPGPLAVAGSEGLQTSPALSSEPGIVNIQLSPPPSSAKAWTPVDSGGCLVGTWGGWGHSGVTSARKAVFGPRVGITWATTY
jgi:hypothetical protein